ncbi:hypothetical protein XYCOK13_23970 [Xylanibacillus composti]|uniref:Cyclic peptide transporter n=1 Tax=Xylanibacillus composti TaxID=1572762 RepID=A0A8J4H6U9_9BACL|nr:cyclic peptide export ABC transporter [Xylanibacillus composti]GIQ69573.1 hypothetical protein XYCOK13_23970 [Xylanibacillus composti]
MIRTRLRWLSLCLFMTALLVGMALGPSPAPSAAAALSESDWAELIPLVEKYRKESGIPGMSVVLVSEDGSVFKQGFGYADRGENRPVTADTLFELGSTSKAFTALALLQLEEQGLVELEAPVQQYLPWFQMVYEGQPADMRLYHLLHHTSGIPFKSIGAIPEATGDDALERTVRTLVGGELDFAPGEEYLYATINYDVLGLIIQELSGLTYEAYVEQHVLAPLGMNDTYLFRDEASARMATGYRWSFLRLDAYDAPIYRGNTPAGYVISSANDLEKWLRYQLGWEQPAEWSDELRLRAQLPDRSVAPSPDGASYAAGWAVFQRGSGEISHGGNNPNFSAFIALRPGDGFGVAVLANLNSAYTEMIGQSIVNQLLDKELPDPPTDLYKTLDQFSSSIVFVLIPVSIVLAWLIGRIIWEALQGRRRYSGSRGKLAASMGIFLLFVSGIAYSLYQLPNVLFNGLNWPFMYVWTSSAMPAAAWSLFVAVCLFSVYYILSVFYAKPKEKAFFSLILLSFVSGFGNALIIFIVNEALNREGFQSGLLLYFSLGLLLYVVGQKLVRTRLIHITNQMVYEKRVVLIDKLLDSSYQHIEKMERGRIEASLNNDTETISNFSNIVITGATSLVTLICCFVYMGMLSLYGLLVSLGVIVLAAGLHFLMGKQANRLWEQTRDIQNIFFKFIQDLIAGFKELSLHARKRDDFKADMKSSSQTYKEKRILGDMKFANVNVIGELLFTFVVGVIAFLFPLLFTEMKDSAIRSYVFVLLYMTGPIHGILGTIPNIYMVRISWKRINALVDQLEAFRDKQQTRDMQVSLANPVVLELRGVSFRYDQTEDGSFSVGPIDYEFRSGEITFITGGNGSGKSTLAKLLTGLYTPTSGDILINGRKATSEALSQHYSAIYSDFHLFEKLYGMEADGRQDQLNTYLQQLQLSDKVSFADGAFSTIQLSTGQRKRLALVISYLEDRPIYLFDEWAADQDPEFRTFFYRTLLPELKERGKCIIAITHDDRFFDCADYRIKMDMGKMSELKPALDGQQRSAAQLT